MIVIYAIGDDEIRDKNAEIEKLLAEISCGNASAAGALYDLIKTDVFAYALSKTGNKADAEDVMQNVFLKIYKNATRYVPEGKPMAWIFTVEINLIRRFFKIKSRTTALDEKAANYAAAESPETTAVNNAFLRELLKTLTEEEREIIVLHVVSGLKHREIAKLLEKPLSTVLSKYNRALGKLQAVVKERR